LPPCSACKLLVSSFERGIERTSRGKFEGGDAAWEEKNQGKGYATSEVRFVKFKKSCVLTWIEDNHSVTTCTMSGKNIWKNGGIWAKTNPT